LVTWERNSNGKLDELEGSGSRQEAGGAAIY
jgi:hypothetical protein